MIHYRPFQNSDPPRLVEIWRSRAHVRSLAQPMSVVLLEQAILAKPYFDRQGLIVAEEEGRPIGFVHAGFGPSDDGSRLCTDLGAVLLLLVHPHPRELAISAELLAQAEAYLRARGAKVLYGGGIRPLNPFYLGLYGGSELPGVLRSDETAQALYREHGYDEIDRVVVLHRELATMRPVVDRQQLQIHRRVTLDVTTDPPAESWWEACTMGQFERTRFQLRPREAGPPIAAVTYWFMEALSTTWGVHTAGLVDLEVAEPSRRQGLGTYLVCESLRRLHALGFALVEAQTMQHNAAALALYQKLGFSVVDYGTVFRKNATV